LSYLGSYSTGYGSYGYGGFKVVTVEEALRQQFGNDAVTFVAGACPSDVQVNQSGIQAAVAAASRADVIVMVLGDTGEGNHTTDHLATGGEGRDRCSLLPAGASQPELLQAVLAVPALAQRLIVVHIGSRPMTFPDNSALAAQIPAILTAMRPGEEGGAAIVDILTGAVVSGAVVSGAVVSGAVVSGAVLVVLWS
jgi:beta-glucosidase